MLDMIATAHAPLTVAVSGGVDSISLLHMLVQKGEPLLVAHVNHGIRADSDADETFVRDLAALYKCPFVTTRLHLGTETSEDAARQARYSWLEKVATKHGSATIVTAHHQDDVLETILINLTRGTGWRGLCSLRSTTRRLRPLLTMTKVEVVNYAIEHHLNWNEDSTNENMRYLRNRIRHQIVPMLTSELRGKLVALYDSQVILRDQIQSESRTLTGDFTNAQYIDRHPIIMIDQNVAAEILKTWLREPLEAQRMSDLLLFAKVARPGDKWSLDSSRYVVADKTRLIVLTP